MSFPPAGRKGIKDVFYETRVLSGRQYTLRRFAEEKLGGAVDPVMLGYIEKGQRFPSEALVRRLAAIRQEDPRALLALLWRDRIVHAMGRELRRVWKGAHVIEGVEDAELAVLVSQAVAALPEDGRWIPLAQWRRLYAQGSDRRARRMAVGVRAAAEVERILRRQGLVEVRGGRVRRRGRHYVARERQEQQSLAAEFCALFAKSLVDKLALFHRDTGTYLRNHYLHIPPAKLPEFHQRLDRALADLAREYASDPGAGTRFLNILVAATPF